MSQFLRAAGRATTEWRLGTDISEMTLRRAGYDTTGSSKANLYAPTFNDVVVIVETA